MRNQYCPPNSPREHTGGSWGAGRTGEHLDIFRGRQYWFYLDDPPEGGRSNSLAASRPAAPADPGKANEKIGIVSPEILEATPWGALDNGVASGEESYDDIYN